METSQDIVNIKIEEDNVINCLEESRKRKNKESETNNQLRDITANGNDHNSKESSTSHTPSTHKQKHQTLKRCSVWVKEGKDCHLAEVLCSTPDDDGRILIEWCWGRRGEEWVSMDLVVGDLKRRSRRPTRFFIQSGDEEDNEEENRDGGRNEISRMRERKGGEGRLKEAPRKKTTLKKTATNKRRKKLDNVENKKKSKVENAENLTSDDIR